MRDLIQIAGVKNRSEADMLVRAGIHWIGFPLYLDVHQPDLSPEATAEVIRQLPDSVKPVCITYLRDPEQLLRVVEQLGINHVQLHGPVSESEIKQLRLLAPDLYTIKSLVIGKAGRDRLEADMRRWAPYVDAFITDTFDPVSGASGATGKTHDWSLSRRLVELSPRPVILAGGLNAGNVAAAIETVGPAGVDVHTGVEDELGNKDPDLVAAFVTAARDAFSCRACS